MAADYLVDYYSSLGFEPYDGENYTQMVPLINSQVTGGTITVGESQLNILDDFLLYPGIQVEALNDVPLVFAGHGIQEDGWDDYTGLDVKGKAVVVLSGDSRENGKTNWGQNTNRKECLLKSLAPLHLLY